MRIGRIRGYLYETARLLGDVEAAKKGTFHKRLVRRVLGRALWRLLGKIAR